MNKLILVVIPLLVFAIHSHAQDGVSKYFDDGGISENKRLVKAGIDLLNREYSVLYEQEIWRNMSIEVAMGLSSISRQRSLYNWDPNYDLPESGMGVFLATNIRLYLREYYEQWYIGFQPKFNIMGGKLMTDIVFFNGGYQLRIQKNLTLDFNIGMGVRTYKYVDEITSIMINKDRDSHFYIPATIKLGYAF